MITREQFQGLMIGLLCEHNLVAFAQGYDQEVMMVEDHVGMGIKLADQEYLQIKQDIEDGHLQDNIEAVYKVMEERVGVALDGDADEYMEFLRK